MNVFSSFLAVQSACSIADGTFFVIKWLLYLYLFVAKLLQKSEMRKDIVIELSYKGFG